MLYLEIGTVVVLIVINGLLAMSELAIVSSRPARLKAMVDRNVRGAGRALKLSANPGRFLSTVQIGITLVGVFSGAFSGATLGGRLGETLIAYGVPYRMAGAIGVGIVVAVITYGSLIIGELVPKQIALRNPEAIAVRAAPFMTVLAKVAAPWRGCSTSPDAPSSICSANARRAKSGSPTKRSRCWSPRPSTTAPSNRTSAG